MQLTLIPVYLFYFIMFFSHVSFAKIVSWSVNRPSSLQVVDMQGVAVSNTVLILDSHATNHHLRLEDIIIPKNNIPNSIFVRFDKQRVSSYVTLRLYDVFTDSEVFSTNVLESGVVSIDSEKITINQLSLVVEIYGLDITLHSVGMEVISQQIMENQGLKISNKNIKVGQDLLEIDLTLHQAAEISVILYNRNGEVDHIFLNNTVLAKGKHFFSFNPQELSFDYRQDKTYYVWFKASNLRSRSVELIETISFIP